MAKKNWKKQGKYDDGSIVFKKGKAEIAMIPTVDSNTRKKWVISLNSYNYQKKYSKPNAIKRLRKYMENNK